MSKPKIYISSTFIDLQDHRQYLIKTLSKTESFDIVSMENYGTRSSPPLQKCLKDVASSEFYILLLGKRYGFIPTNYELSVTNLEYKIAIGSTDGDVGGVPVTTRCVLPFILDENWIYPETVVSYMDGERLRDGNELTKKKNDRLEKWKGSILEHFIIDERFTTPSDLASKVLAALIPELIDRNYADVVKGLKLRPELSYRCDRSSIRNEFLFHNHNTKAFFKVFIIHGQKPEWPVFFSNNIAEYELNAGDNSKALNMDNYNSNFPEKFLGNFILDVYQNIFKVSPELPMVSLEALALKVIEDPRLANVVLIYDMEYASWKEKYKRHLTYLFSKLAEANTKLSVSKSFYLLINIRYEKTKERIRENPPASILLDRLSSVRKSHVEEWVRAYFFLNTRREDKIRNYAHDLAQKISDHYFQEYTAGASFTMETAKDRLVKIIHDFNNNENLFKQLY